MQEGLHWKNLSTICVKEIVRNQGNCLKLCYSRFNRSHKTYQFFATERRNRPVHGSL